MSIAVCGSFQQLQLSRGRRFRADRDYFDSRAACLLRAGVEVERSRVGMLLSGAAAR